MNPASQDLPRHLGILQQKLQQGADYERALYYFLEEFAGDAQFVQQCEPEEALHVVAALGQVATNALGQRVTLEQPRAFRLRSSGSFMPMVQSPAASCCSSTSRRLIPGLWRCSPQ
jgi:hypothetical protein